MPVTRLAIACVAVLLLGPAPARAYSDTARFEEGAEVGGGGGRRFTGSPADGFTCAVCHDEEAEAEVEVRGFPTDGYRAGVSYAIELDWPDDALVAFALEVVDRNGETSGVLALPAAADLDAAERCASGAIDPPPPAATLHPTADGRVVAVADGCGANRATIHWAAPDASTGPVFLYVAAVSGDRSGTSDGDAVRTVARSAPAAGSPPAEVSVVDSGCSAASRRPSRAWLLFLAAILVLLGRSRCRAIAPFVTVALVLGSGTLARAVPGPDSVAVLSNANVPESVALGEAYAAARDVPDAQVCAIDAPTDVTVALDTFRDRIVTGLETCLGDSLDRIEAVVVMRGLPLRVEMATTDGMRRVSIGAALGVWRSTIGGAPILGEPPGTTAMCGGSSCYAARFLNPFRSGPFEAGWTRTTGTIAWQPLLVTMLHARSYEDAEKLLTSAIEAEAMGGADGELLFMDGSDAARGALDFEYDAVIGALRDRGFTDASRVPFDANLTGRSLASFFTGTASLGETIEGNTFRPGALVDNLTSFGAVPQNFEPTGESQVSIARWVAMGVAGAHGTTDEPLNNVFPSRWLLVDYVDGATLAEAYHARMPYTYWHNLVLGDPMLAPYAIRPDVVVDGVIDGEVLDAPRPIAVHASDPEGVGVATVVLYVDGVEVARADGPDLETCLTVPAGTDLQILAVAQKLDDDSDRGRHRPKGWTSLRIDSAGTSGECAPDVPDAGPLPDAAGHDSGPESPDAGPPTTPDAGCSCSTPQNPNNPLWFLLLLPLLTKPFRKRVSLGTVPKLT